MGIPQSVESGGLSSLDSKDLRRALGHFVTGVSIVTTRSLHGQPLGLTVNSFSSVSLDPPLVLWSLSNRSVSLEHFRESGHFAIHVLTHRQRGLAERFASPIADRFAEVQWSPSADGTPLIAGCAARFRCRTVQAIEAGDHHIFLGEVLELQEPAPSEPPLVFYRGQLHARPEPWAGMPHLNHNRNHNDKAEEMT